MNTQSLLRALALASLWQAAYADSILPGAMNAGRLSSAQPMESLLQSTQQQAPQPIGWLEANQHVLQAGGWQRYMAGSAGDAGSHQGMDHSQHQNMDHSKHQDMNHSQHQNMDHSKHQDMNHSGHQSTGAKPKETDNAHSNHH